MIVFGLRLTILALSLAFVAGCATASQRQFSAFAERLERANNRIAACLASADEADDWQARLPRAAWSRFPPLEKLEDRSIITDDERVAIVDHRNVGMPCREITLAEYDSISPRHASLHRTFFALNDMTAARLMSGEISWGRANRERLEQSTALQGDVTDLNNSIVAQANALHASEVSMVQQNIRAVNQWSQNQQIINSLARPTYTNCQMIGSTISCSQF